MIFYEVDDVDQWLTSPKRREVLARSASRLGRSSTPSSRTALG